MAAIIFDDRFSFLVFAMLSLLAFFAPGCSDDDYNVCRFDPARCPNGEAGAFCKTDADCLGICCTEKANCASGMCTYPCKDDRDCPVDMACEHDVCFYRCQHDSDCAPGQSCEHGNTVCEWP
jgi:hypothetical protein